MILKKRPYDQNPKNVFSVKEIYNPVYTGGTKTIYTYSIDQSSVTVASAANINITEPGGSAATHSLGGTFATTTAAGRAALATAINDLLESLGYSRGVAVHWDDPNFEIHTDFSEIVFNWIGVSGNGDFTQSGTGKVVSF